MTTIEKLKFALNKIPNIKNVGPNGESTYDLVKELEKQKFYSTKELEDLMDEAMEDSDSLEDFRYGGYLS
jgi:hypothetical protein